MIQWNWIYKHSGEEEIKQRRKGCSGGGAGEKTALGISNSEYNSMEDLLGSAS